MKIKILHLYHDLMNLYGEYGNVKAMVRFFTKTGAEAEVIEKTITDALDFTDIDFIYLGAGTEKNQKIILNHLKNYEEGLKAYLEQGGYALFTGNSFEILGEKIYDGDGNCIQGLKFCPFETREQKKQRMTGDAIVLYQGLEEPLVGFINKCSEIEGNEQNGFKVEMGMGDKEGKKEEGLLWHSLIGTHLTGPVLIKNPHFLFELGKRLWEAKTGEYLDHEVENRLRQKEFLKEFAAYEVTLKKLRERK